FKESIESMEHASEVIFSLRPVTFRYPKESERNSTSQFGLVADEVAKVAPGLVVRDENGQPRAVRYDAINAMLLNEFLKSHGTLEEQTSKDQAQDSTISRLRALCKEQHEEIAALNDGTQQ